MIGKGAALSAELTAPAGPDRGPGSIELAELGQAIRQLRRVLAQPRTYEEADRAAAKLSLTAHFLNLAPSTTGRFRLWMGHCAEAATELLGDPLAHLRPLDTLDPGAATQLLDRVAERLGLSTHLG